MSLSIIQATGTAVLEPPPAVPVQRLPQPNVPWWAQSKASDLLNRIGAIHRADTSVVKRLLAPVTARVKRQPGSPLRKETQVGLRRDWIACLDNKTRLAPVIIDDHKKGLTITDCRISCIGLSFTDWPEDHYEKWCCCSCACYLCAGQFGVKTERLAYFSAHSLGRWYERASIDSSDTALLSTFQMLLINHENLLLKTPFAARSPFGAWVGEVGTHDHSRERVLECKSFLGPREIRKNGG